MVLRKQGRRFAEEKVPCKGSTIGDLIEYLEQFPKEWPICVRTPDGHRFGERFVLLDEDVSTVLTEEGEGLGP